MQPLLLHDILLKMFQEYCLVVSILISHIVISIPFYSPCHESNCPWGCDRGQMRMALTFVTICLSEILVICM